LQPNTQSIGSPLNHHAAPSDGRTKPARRRDAAIVLLAAIASLSILAAGLAVFDPRESVDTRRYLELGERLAAAWRSDCGADPCDLERSTMFPSYVVSSFYLWSIDRLFPDSPLIAAAVANMVLFAFATALVFRTWLLLPQPGSTDAGLTLCVGLCVIFGMPIVPLWSYWMLSETLFLLIVAGFILSVVQALIRRRPVYWAMAAVIACIGVFTRPPGLLLPFLLLAAFMLAWRSCNPVTVRKRTTGLALLGAGMAFIVIPLFFSIFTGDTSFAGYLPEHIRFKILQAAHFYREGWVVADQPDTYVSNDGSFTDYLWITVRRFAYYFLPIKSTFSLPHNLLNAVYLMLALPGLLVGVRNLLRTGKQTTETACWLLLTALLFGLLHSVTLVSYEWRYQVPAMVPLWLLAGVGLMSLAENGRQRLAARKRVGKSS